ncbi:transmembrane transporter [Schizosaccharomyces pombe]|uniref:UNC93-like protein C922.05c n=1 Tax=Schizosaccharomyces pombe (strain 972 / ATCC 24843) TaxID=284812 RepID=YLX5_SCHPO|nr:putative transporter [Schizosaccharomyces pombe]Q9URX1.1 RecName: Full=UNC93-like protein C922.05c [Schizosaccharomyces pombe 972h-]CAB63552.1 membrane transporter (predicted) [Schizosaccharomyces pombe]|eukprot:NP_595005.1 putative transporter [Schizosaccharomyces pombe]
MSSDNLDISMEKKYSADVDVEKAPTPEYGEVETAPLSQSSWIYRRPRIGRFKSLAYGSALTQTIIVSWVCFLCPGMFNALSGLGGGGEVNADVANDANVALYSTFAGLGFFAGSICNLIGVKLTLAIGGTGYSVYTASLLCYKHVYNRGFVIFGGCYLGLTAGMLWAAQGAVIMSYPREENKARYIAIFWGIFNLGAVIGSIVPLAQTMHSSVNSVGDGTYAGFIVLMAVGSALALFMVSPEKTVKEDGKFVHIEKSMGWKKELLGLVQTLYKEYWVLLLFPMFFSSNWFTTYQFNDFNLAYFNIRTRSLNNLLYWFAQIMGSAVAALFLDWQRFNRVIRARVGWGLVFVLICVIWGGGLAFQLKYTRKSVAESDFVVTDFTHRGYTGYAFLYIFYGMLDAIFQSYAYWIIGSLSNDTNKLAVYMGFYKSLQSAGAAITYRMDTLNIPYMNYFASCWALLCGSLIVASPVIWKKIKLTTEGIEDEIPPLANGLAVDGPVVPLKE